MAVTANSRVGARENMMKIVKEGDKKVYLVAQELKLAKVLAGNNKQCRDRALKQLKSWFAKRTETMSFTEEDLQRIWKGLFYSMWLSDKPLIQEECAENISKLLEFETLDFSLLFFKAGLTILMNEWFGIDQLRLDKFLMLVRRLLRQTLFVLKKFSLNKKTIASFNNVLSATILNTDKEPPLGLFMHFTEIFLEELAKVTEGKLHPDRVVDMLRPFLKKMVSTKDRRQIGHIRKFIFTYLIKQSKVGLEYQAKYNAWKQQGFPGSIDSMQKVKLDTEEQMSTDKHEENVTDKPFDPRAGRVNVDISEIKINAKYLVSILSEFKNNKSSNAESRNRITTLMDQFSKLSKGIYPFEVKRIRTKDKDDDHINIRKAANKLIKFEQKLLGKNNRKRKPEKENEVTNVIEKKRRKIEKKHLLDEQNVEAEQKKVMMENNKNKKKTSLKNSKTHINNNKAHNDGIDQDQNNKLAGSCDSSHIENKKTAKKKRIKEEIVESGNIKSIVNNIECVFERNSGTWIVFDTSREGKNEMVPSTNTEVDRFVVQEVENASRTSNNSDRFENTNLDESKKEFQSNISKKITSARKSSLAKLTSSIENKNNSSVKNGSTKSGLNPVKLFECSADRKELFSKSEWDVPLQEGEYEIYIPSKQPKKLSKKNGNSVQTVINNTMKNIKGKSRVSRINSIVNNNLYSTDSTKKVKINTKLNRSQEVHEHHAQLLSSPAIPYDANKKPTKPLLKTPLKATPVNPFYNIHLTPW